MEKHSSKQRQHRRKQILTTVCLTLIFLSSGFVQATNSILAQTVTANFKNATLNGDYLGNSKANRLHVHL